MKNIYLFNLSKSLLAASILSFGIIGNSNAQSNLQNPFKKDASYQATPKQQNLRISAIKSLPLNSDDYGTSGSGGWTLMGKSKYRYDAAGRRTSRIRMDASGTQNQYKDSVSYDAQGNESFYGSFQWQNNAWDISYGEKYLRTYNAAGKETEEIRQSMNNGVWENESRKTITPNAAGNPLVETYYSWDANAWQLSERATYTYPSPTNPPTEITYQEYTNGNWVNTERYINLVWHNAAAFEISSYVEQEWVNNAWVNLNKGTYTYTTNGGYVNLEEEWVNNAWVNDWRRTVTYDNQLNLTGDRDERWQNNAWVTDYESQEILTYNATNDVTQRIYRYWDSANNMLKDSWKEIYSNFLRVTGTAKDLPALNVSIYPNPATSNLTFQLEATDAVVLMKDLTGRLVKTEKLPVGTNRMDISTLPSGVYLVEIQTKKGSAITKIMKQ